ncbi:unnamed protein product [Ectocarpus sp. 4 AP-2014]
MLHGGVTPRPDSPSRLLSVRAVGVGVLRMADGDGDAMSAAQETAKRLKEQAAALRESAAESEEEIRPASEKEKEVEETLAPGVRPEDMPPKQKISDDMQKRLRQELISQGADPNRSAGNPILIVAGIIVSSKAKGFERHDPRTPSFILFSILLVVTWHCESQQYRALFCLWVDQLMQPPVFLLVDYSTDCAATAGCAVKVGQPNGPFCCCFRPRLPDALFARLHRLCWSSSVGRESSTELTSLHHAVRNRDQGEIEAIRTMAGSNHDRLQERTQLVLVLAELDSLQQRWSVSPRAQK